MRIATWNVNSLKARMEAVEKWLARAEPWDVVDRLKHLILPSLP